MSQHFGKRKNADGIAGGVLLTVVASVPSLPGRRQWRPMPLSCRFGKYLANKALDQAPDGEMPATVPIPPSQSHYIAGARIYKENSALCHALPRDRTPTEAICPCESRWKLGGARPLDPVGRYSVIRVVLKWVSQSDKPCPQTSVFCGS